MSCKNPAVLIAMSLEHLQGIQFKDYTPAGFFVCLFGGGYRFLILYAVYSDFNHNDIKIKINQTISYQHSSPPVPKTGEYTLRSNPLASSVVQRSWGHLFQKQV